MSQSESEVRSAEWVVYPNPSDYMIKVESKRYKDAIKFLYNSLGQLMLSTKENEIDVSGLHKGVYYLMCRTNKESSNRIMPASVKSYNLLNLWFRQLAHLAANNQINSGEEWELNEKRMNEALIYSSTTPLDSLEQSLKDDIATLAHSCPFAAGQAVYKARRIWSFWQPNALFDDRVLCLQTENKNGEGEIEDIDEYYNQQIGTAKIRF
ncbi:MAG: T9SS type A sorting domain-containing protein [Bacteroidota bacterium]|nr:MAG: T9SS type A sorting domain-containing protein [Bacteroidota bacterium]